MAILKVLDDGTIVDDCVAYGKRLDENVQSHKYGYERGYEKGANDVWELAKRLFISSDFGGFTGDEVLEIFGTMDPCEVATSHSGIDALKRYREYEEKKKKEINVGDEVRCKNLDNPELIVTRIYRDEGKFDALGYDGSACVDMTLDFWEKTGKHIELGFIKEN